MTEDDPDWNKFSQGIRSSLAITGPGTRVATNAQEAEKAWIDGNVTTPVGDSFGQDTSKSSNGQRIEIITELPK